jgi:phospholipid/cholesterol/gamma-HCH transport system permease protein
MPESIIPRTPQGVARFSLERATDGRVRIAGTIGFTDASRVWKQLEKLRKQSKGSKRLDLDVSGLEAVDGSSAALLVHFRSRLLLRGVQAEFSGAQDGIRELIHLYGGDQQEAIVHRRRRPKGMFDQLGTATMNVLSEAKLVLAFVGQLVLSATTVIRRPRTANWRDFTSVMERAGADAVPIVLLINFLVGFVMALQSSPQLEAMGANILVADLIGIAMLRELAPLMTAIIVCGRSGAAFAAELGSMKVNEELDALRAMGFEPSRFLVVPRVLALVVVMPPLVLMADAMGCLGGLAVAVLHLDLTPTAYILELEHALSLRDLLSGLVKSGVFGIAIALISCQQGMATDGGAEGVGRRTTSSVVMTLFVLVLIDALFTAFFRATGL